MKRLLFIALALAFSVISYGQQKNSCCHNTGLKCSANSISNIQGMTLSELRNLDRDKQIVAWGQFNPTQRYNFWKEKFQEVKQMNWTPAEIKHINKAEAFLNTHKSFFKEKKLSKKQNEELEAFFKTWANQAQKQLGWTPKLCNEIMMTLDKVTSKDAANNHT